MDQLAKKVASVSTEIEKIDLSKTPLRELNQALHGLKAGTNGAGRFTWL